MADDDRKETVSTRRAAGTSADDDVEDNELVNQFISSTASHHSMSGMNSDSWNHLRAMALELVKSCRSR